VLTQVRNGRIKRVEESLNAGFDISATDERGNTLLVVATQQCNLQLIEVLLKRGAGSGGAINQRNAGGNTALHYALAYDPEGRVAEYLIEHGADDTVLNNAGLSCYDGLDA
jgi:ankyrin repeat protein